MFVLTQFFFKENVFHFHKKESIPYLKKNIVYTYLKKLQKKDFLIIT